MRQDEEQILLASNVGDLALIQRTMINSPSVDLNCCAENGATPLCCSSYHGHIHVVRFLVSRSALVDKRSSDSYSVTPLYAASQEGHYDVVRFLVESGANCRARCLQTGCTPLQIAAQMGHLSIVEFLAKEVGIPALRNSGEGQKALVLALAKENYDIMRYLVKVHGIPLDFRIQCGMTPLCYAASRGNALLVAFLLEMGASPNGRACEPTFDRFSAFCSDIRSTFVRFLFSTFSDTKNSEQFQHRHKGYCPLKGAISNSHADVVLLLLKHGVELNDRRAGKESPLLLSIRAGSLEISKMLVDHGALVTMGNNRSEALLAACKLGNEGIVRLLVENGVDFRRPVEDNGEKVAPLACACKYRQNDVIFYIFRQMMGSMP